MALIPNKTAKLTEEARSGNKVTFGMDLFGKKTTFTLIFEDAKEIKSTNNDGLMIITKEGAPINIEFTAMESFYM